MPPNGKASAAAAPKRKKQLGFDPYSIEPFDDWTADEIRLVVCYWWEYAKNTWYKENVNRPDYFREKFAKMAAEMPKGWQPPKAGSLPTAKSKKFFRPDGTEYPGGWNDGEFCPDRENTGFRRDETYCPCTKWYLADGTEIDPVENNRRLAAKV